MGAPWRGSVDGCCLLLPGSSSRPSLSSPGGLEPEPAWAGESEQEGSAFGAFVSSAGDVNDDGYGDLLVGAMWFNGRSKEEGKAYLFLGSEAGLRPQPDWASGYPLPIQGGVNGDDRAFFGFGVGPAGDVNGDGLSDFIIGTPYAAHGQKDEGVALVYYGSRTRVAKEPAWTFDGDRSNGHLGEFVSSAGDVNGDGVPDLLLAGTDYAEFNEPFTRVVVVYGQRGGLTGSSNWSPHKPFLAVLQQRIERLPRWTLRIVAGSGVLLLVGGLLLVQVRLRRQLATVIAENRQLAATQERTRIARDIHDHLGADLTRLAAQLDRAAETTNWTALQKLGDSAQQAIKSLDELVWATNPEQDTLEGLANYLAEFAPGFLEAHGLGCDLAFPAQLPPCRLPAQARHNLFLIAKEAMRNAAQHAAATRVRVTLNLTDHELRLTIEDDGCGLTGTGNNQQAAQASCAREAGGPAAPAGNGLRNMRARAEALGGRLVIEPSFSGGTRLSVVVPIENGPERG